MSKPLDTLNDTLDLLASEFGVSWPNPWWPTGKSTYNDCAAAMSWALWGLNGDQPYYTYVSQLINVFQQAGQYHSGNAGIQAGDILIFNWEGTRVPDHTEMATGPAHNGLITSRGTNSSGGDNMHDHTRSLSLVIGYGRPDYPTTNPSGGGTTPIEGNKMARIIVVDDGPEQNVTYLISGGRLSLIQPLDQVALQSALQIVDATGGEPGYKHVSGQQIIYIKGLLGYTG